MIFAEKKVLPIVVMGCFMAYVGTAATFYFENQSYALTH